MGQIIKNVNKSIKCGMFLQKDHRATNFSKNKDINYSYKN